MADPVTLTLMAAGTAMSAAGQIKAGDSALRAGKANRDAAYAEADNLDIQAGQEVAVASHNQSIIAKRMNEILAKQRANAAAGGGSTTDATVVAIQKEAVGTSVLDQLREMAGAEERASQIRYKGEVTRQGGDIALAQAREQRSASRLAAATTIVKGGASWADKFGGGGTTTPTSTVPKVSVNSQGIGDFSGYLE